MNGINRMARVIVVSYVVVGGWMSASTSVASDVDRVDVIERIGAGGSTHSYSQPPFVQASDCNVAGTRGTKVEVIKRIGAGGSTYSYSQPPSVQASDCNVVGTRGTKEEVIMRIGAGGSTYSYSGTRS